MVRHLLAGPPQITQQDAVAAEFFDLPLSMLGESSTDVDVWPEHQRPLQLFAAMSTQWRMGPRMPVGLDYAVIPLVAEMQGIPRDELRDELWPVLRQMEVEALQWFGDKVKAADAR